MRWGLLLPAAVATATLLTGSLPAAAAPSLAAGPATAAAAAGAPLYAFNTGLVLTVSARAARGASVRVAANSGTAGQRWIFGRHQTLRPAANQELCLNVPGARYRGGAKLQLWTCDGHASERFSTSAPSRHTAVYFLRPAARTKYCLTSLNSPPYEAGAHVGLEACAALTTQTWSGINLDGVASGIDDGWGIQAQHPATAGSAVTAANTFANQLDQFWIASNVGASNNSPVLLSPVEDTSLCAEPAAPEGNGVHLDLAACTGSASQQFIGIGLIFNVSYTWTYLTTPDSAYCVQTAASGPASARPVVLGSCVGNNRDFWLTSLDLTSSTSGQFQEIYAGPATGPAGLEFSMQVGGSGGPGSGIVLGRDNQAAGQVWTDLAPGQAKATGNPDGSITLRPLSDESLCLAVPGGNYAAGVQLTVQTCDGQVDQEFVRNGQFGSIGLVAAGSGEFCVTAPGGFAAGSAVQLEPCAQQDDQTWSTFFSWYGWAGQPLTSTWPVADPGDSLILSGANPAGGQVGVAPSPGPAAWYTSQDWLQMNIAGGAEIRSVYDPGLCLDAPGTAAGTELTAAPCTGGTAQTFQFLGSTTTKGDLWWLRATTPAKMCVAVGSVSGSGGLPLLLEPCSSAQADQAWTGPSYQL
jgi:Ricin-type beta-trefoil lectin domain